MNVYIFSPPINIFKILLKSSHNIEYVLSSSIFLSDKSAIFNPFDLTCFQDMFLKRKMSRDSANTMLTTNFDLPKRKKIPMLWTTETTIFIRKVGIVFMQGKQSYLWFIANNDRNMSQRHNTDNFSLNLSWNIHAYHVHSLTSQASLEDENGSFNVTLYKWNNSHNHGHNADNYFLNLS